MKSDAHIPLHTMKQMIAAILYSCLTAVCLAAGDGDGPVTSGHAGVPNFWDDIPLSPSTRMPSVVLDDYWNSEFQRVNREVVNALLNTLELSNFSTLELLPLPHSRIHEFEHSRILPLVTLLSPDGCFAFSPLIR